ncbi:hypothetical protein ILYODFUR_008203 [Ilyodon furcidens]|uniref:Uncharacterized protein n=1 Tax=Ilyodon furcidens TaxID=33524 RepID=A0ABV0T6A2_9TELE
MLYYWVYSCWLFPGFDLRPYLYETCPPSTAPLVPSHNPPNTVIDQGTKYLCKTRLYSSTLFPPARHPLLLAVCQQGTTLPTLSRPCLFL